MTTFSDWIDPSALKAINRDFLLEAADEVGGAELRKRVEVRTAMVADRTLARFIHEPGELDCDRPTAAWSHWMALITIRQPFFDANHRTALAAFNLVLARACKLELSMTNEVGEAMMTGSRVLVLQAHKPSAAGRRDWSIKDLRDANHPARVFYADFEDRLILTAID